MTKREFELLMGLLGNHMVHIGTVTGNEYWGSGDSFFEFGWFLVSADLPVPGAFEFDSDQGRWVKL